MSSLESASSEDSRAKRKIKNAPEKVQQEEQERLRKLAEQRAKEKEEQRRQKELMKKMETPEQKRLRRLAKKEAKEKKRKEMAGWDDEYMGYTNTDNPFGDSNLHNTFVWSKKYEKLGIKDVRPEDIERENKMKLEETRRELEKVKQRRLEREREREERQEEMNRAQREKELAQFQEWEKQEDGFHLRQAKLRSKLRIKDGRAKPIDKIARYFDVHADKNDAEREEEERDKEEDDEDAYNFYAPIELREPYKNLNGLRTSDLEDLLEDIKVYMTLDRPANVRHWKDMLTIVEDELAKLRNYSSKNERRDGINAAVAQDVVSMFEGKTPYQLSQLQMQIEAKISAGEQGTDISYWETLLSKLKAHMARARLKEKHEENMARRLRELQEKQGLSSAAHQSSSSYSGGKSGDDFKAENERVKSERGDLEAPSSSAMGGDDNDSDAELEEVEYVDPVQQCKEEYISGRYSPIYLQPSQLDSSITVVDADEDIRRIAARRDEVFGRGSGQTQPMTAAEAAFEKEAAKGMNKDEAMFSVEEHIKQDKTVLSWAEKYRPRKPRYFNRVHTGFEWNKYNQTHYDVDNPPPKVVQGYKFNIFYPDLIDKKTTPKYTITPCQDNREFAIIKFTAGPPYEDIAFKIVNREWNYSYKSGFRCQFHNNILQLWFHFKRYRYRR